MPASDFYEIDGISGAYIIKTRKVCANLTQAENTITQRMRFPSCAAEVTVDVSGLLEGDYAGICALQSCYGMVAATKRNGELWLVMKSREALDHSSAAMEADYEEGEEHEAVRMSGALARLRVEADFMQMKDEVRFFYHDGEKFIQIGIDHKLYFKVDHFAGCRFGLFCFASKQTGGKACFRHFVYE